MAGSRGPGGQSQWARQQAAQLRAAEAARKAADRHMREQERLRQQQHIDAQLRSAEQRTTEVERQAETLDRVLIAALASPPLTFERLKMTTVVPAFDPGPLGMASAAPRWEKYAPDEPRGLGRLFGGAERYAARVGTAREQFERAVADHRQREARRQQQLADARARHGHQVAEAAASDAAHNADIDARALAYSQGEPEAVEWFVGHILDRSIYPPGFARQHQVAYRPENRDVVIEMELPELRIVPTVRAYRYVKARDAVEPIPRPENEIKQRYALLIGRVALRTLHEVFGATDGDVVEAVVFNGCVDTIDRATGKKTRPHLLSVQAERLAFADLELAEVDPARCLKHLNALVSANPFDLEPIEPFIAFDLKRFRFVDDLDVVAGLDSRRNLLDLSPVEFEHLVRQLFVAMGAEAWATVPSKDGGVDAVATSKNLFFGGVCFIQAKRWTNLVGLESVHALTGVMADHNATTGVLVTTSWFGRASEQFAQRNRITLINGAELKSLIKQHLNQDVLPGTNPPRRLRASDNIQTGRPGPAVPPPS
jgi:restriction system protein